MLGARLCIFIKPFLISDTILLKSTTYVVTEIASTLLCNVSKHTVIPVFVGVMRRLMTTYAAAAAATPRKNAIELQPTTITVHDTSLDSGGVDEMFCFSRNIVST